MVPFEAASVRTECFEVLRLERIRATSLVLVSFLVIEPIKVIVSSEIGVKENFTKDALVKLGSVKLRSDLVRWYTREGSKNPRKKTTKPPSRSLDHLIVLGNILVRESGLRPSLDVEANHIHEPGNEELGGESGGATGGESLTEDALDASIPPLASARGHGVSHALPNSHGDVHVGGSPDGPPLIVGKLGIAQHSDFELKEP